MYAHTVFLYWQHDPQMWMHNAMCGKLHEIFIYANSTDMCSAYWLCLRSATPYHTILRILVLPQSPVY